MSRVLSSRFLYFLFMCQGIGLLFPWNTLITADGFYKERLAGLSSADKIIPMFAIVFMSVKLLFLLLSGLIVHLIQPEIQVIFSGVGSTLVFIALTLMPLASEDILSKSLFLNLTLLLVFLASVFAAFANNGLYTLLARYDPKFTQAISNGQGLAGVLACLFKIIVIYATSSSSTTSMEIVLTYLLSTLIIGICSILFILFHDRVGTELPKDLEQSNSSIKSSSYQAWKQLCRDYVAAFKDIYPFAISVFLVFLVTLGIFPYFYFLTRSTQPDTFYGSQVFNMMNLLLFNIGDWIGKSIPLLLTPLSYPWIRSAWFIGFLSIIRLVYFPLYLFGNCVLFDPLKSYPFSSILASDVLFYFLSVTFGITNGWAATLAMMYGPSTVTKNDNRSKAGTMMVAALTMGLTFGAYLSFGIASSLDATS